MESRSKVSMKRNHQGGNTVSLLWICCKTSPASVEEAWTVVCFVRLPECCLVMFGVFLRACSTISDYKSCGMWHWLMLHTVYTIYTPYAVGQTYLKQKRNAMGRICETSLWSFLSLFPDDKIISVSWNINRWTHKHLVFAIFIWQMLMFQSHTHDCIYFNSEGLFHKIKKTEHLPELIMSIWSYWKEKTASLWAGMETGTKTQIQLVLQRGTRVVLQVLVHGFIRQGLDF